MEALSDLERLRFYRDEVKHEFGLLASRSTILVTCQSFLVVPYAILNTMAQFRNALVSIYLVAALGIFVALLLVRPLSAGRQTINKWLVKQRSLLQSAEGLRDLAIDRDLIPGSAQDVTQDLAHQKSLAFSTYAPWAFCVFWLLAVVWATLLAI